jgi:DNA-binding transcriptional MocR family regulator
MDATSHEQDWIPRIEGTDGPIYLAIADAIGAAVTAGELRAGERLPTHRALADALRVDLTTVTRAYAEARRRGLLQATVGRGTFVRSPMQAQAPSLRTKGQEGPVDLGMNLPPVPTDPPLQDLLQQGLSRLLAGSEPANLLTYRSGSGTAEERMAGAIWLRPTLGEMVPERVLVCPGAQPALLATLGTLAGTGDVVLTDTLTYPGIRTAAAQLGIRLVGIAADAEGLLPEAVEAACREIRPKALYCTSRQSTTRALEFIPIKPLAATGSGAPGNYAGHSRFPSRHHGRPASTSGSGL